MKYIPKRTQWFTLEKCSWPTAKCRRLDRNTAAVIRQWQRSAYLPGPCWSPSRATQPSERYFSWSSDDSANPACVSDAQSCIRTFSCDIRSALETEDTQPVYLTSYTDTCPPDALFISKLIGGRSPGEIVREALGIFNGAIYPRPCTPAPDANIFQPHWSPEAIFYRAVDLRPSYSFTRRCRYCLVVGEGVVPIWALVWHAVDRWAVSFRTDTHTQWF